MSAHTRPDTIQATYDREADALYIRLSSGEVARSVEIDDARIVDLAADGGALGLEILYPAENLVIASVARDYGFSDRLDEIDDAVANALGPAMQPVTLGIALNYDFLLDRAPAFSGLQVSAGTALTHSTLSSFRSEDDSATTVEDLEHV